MSKNKALLISICYMLMLSHVVSADEGINLASLSGVQASQSSNCGSWKHARKAIDGKRNTYSYACRKKKDVRPEWFKLTLEESGSIIKQVNIYPWKGKNSSLKDSSVAVLDEFGRVAETKNISVRGARKGLTVNFGNGVTGHGVIIQRSKGSKKRKLKLSDVQVIGFPPVSMCKQCRETYLSSTGHIFYFALFHDVHTTIVTNLVIISLFSNSEANPRANPRACCKYDVGVPLLFYNPFK
jgi:hypothetical protein